MKKRSELDMFISNSEHSIPKSPNRTKEILKIMYEQIKTLPEAQFIIDRRKRIESEKYRLFDSSGYKWIQSQNQLLK